MTLLVGTDDRKRPLHIQHESSTNTFNHGKHGKHGKNQKAK